MDTVTADGLRKTAALMRRRAIAATEGDWQPRTDTRESGLATQPEPVRTERVVTDHAGIAICATAADAEHIASWHPDTALAVADWLEEMARFWESPSFPQLKHAAVDVVLTYLREVPR
jgi:hypothetical protein